MPALLSLGTTIVLILWLFKKDMELRHLPSSALWIPAIWLTIIGSRPISLWLSVFGFNVSGTNNLEGSPLDMAVFLSLILSALIVLIQRRFNLFGFVRENKILVAMYLYLSLTALWSENTFVTLKRAIKDFGHVLTALVVISEADPLGAIRIVFVRVSYLLLPLSIVLIKFFPSIGRVPSRSNEALFSGVTMHKNTLGCTVFVLGLILMLDLMQLKKERERRETDVRIRYLLIAMGVWLLITCKSVTSMICLMLGAFLLWGTGQLLRTRDPRRILVRTGLGVILMATIDYVLNVSGAIFNLFGRDSTLTGRTDIWEMVKDAGTDPILGCGFYSFWGTEGAQEISAGFLGTLASAHNGLLEMYLDCGLIGLGLLIVLLWTWFRGCLNQLLDGSLRGRLSFSFFLLEVIRNFSETEYFRFWPTWFTLLILVIKVPSFPGKRIDILPSV